MGKILSHPISKRGLPISIRRRAVIAVILAAALLILAGCGTVIYQSAREIFEYYGRDTYRIHFHFTEPKSTIEEYYIPTYLPDGIEIQNQNKADFFIDYYCRDPENKNLFLTFSQNASNSENVYTLLPISEYLDFTHNGFNCYYTKGEMSNSLYWQNESYVFTITTTVDLSEEELLKIIDGVKLVEE